MNAKKHSIPMCLAAIGMLVLIFDGRTAMQGAADGIQICIRSVIPSLFPFFVLSILLTGFISNYSFRFLFPIGRLCGMRNGTEPLLLTGLLGGYPVGAQSVIQAYQQGQLTRSEAERLLGFCSNAGPAFIFGIAGKLFSSPWIVWILWVIHILSALIVGAILPNRYSGTVNFSNDGSMDFPTAVAKALKITATVCGWIILFRILIAFLNHWFLWLLPQWLQLFCIGILELANGCHSLMQAASEPVRFVISAVILGFGGVCVGMQTISVAGAFGTGMYFPGKLMQGFCSLMLAAFVAPFLFPNITLQLGFTSAGIALLLLFLIRILLSTAKKRVAI